MSMLISILFIIIGFLFLIKGADWVVSGSTSLAKKNNISDLVIGLTIVAFGTSAPELVVNSVASFNNHHDIVFGNLIGSNNFNLFVILGLVGLIFPIKVQSTTVWREIPLSCLAVLVLYFLANSFFFQEKNILSRTDGFILLFLFGCFLYYMFTLLKTESIETEITKEASSNYKIWGFIIIGILSLVFGGKLVVDHAIEVATQLGISKKIISLTIIAVGTSLPELVTSVVAALKKNSDIAIGNVIGSNIFNFLFVFPISSFVNPIEFNTVFNTDIYLLIAGTFFLFIAMFTGEKKKLDRWEAGILLVVYLSYTIYLISKEF